MPDEEETAVETETETGKPAGTPAAAPPVRRVIGREGGEIPEERVSEIRRDAASRERKKLLREMWGTDDEDEVKKLKAKADERVAKAEQLEAEAEKRRMAELTESERLKEELRVATEKYSTELAQLKADRDSTRSTLEVERQDVVITELASKRIAPKFLKTAKVEFGEYVESLTKAELAKLDRKEIDRWFTKYAKENPEFTPQAPKVEKTAEQVAAEADAAKKAAAAVPPKRAPIGAPRGSQSRQPPPKPKLATGAGLFKGKPIKSLTKLELNEYYKSIGMKRAPY